MRLFKIKMWVIDLDKPDYEQSSPICKELTIDKFLSAKYVKKILMEQFKKMLDKWEGE